MTQFSVIIPTRDRTDYLQEAIASVLLQTVTDIEIIIVNDGQTPARHQPDPRIVVLENAERGPVPARNLGVSIARGDNIAFLDDDDRWIDPDFLSKSLAYLTTGAALTFGDGVMLFPGDEHAQHFARDADAKSLEHDNTILISAVCYHRSLHEMLGRFDESLPYYWDWDWYVRVARAGYTLRRIASPVVDIRIHSRNMSGESNVSPRAQNLRAFAEKHGLGELTLKNHASFAERI
jgi:glycosyltransferase involved in cell wall biosynthesis